MLFIQPTLAGKFNLSDISCVKNEPCFFHPDLKTSELELLTCLLINNSSLKINNEEVHQKKDIMKSVFHVKVLKKSSFCERVYFFFYFSQRTWTTNCSSYCSASAPKKGHLTKSFLPENKEVSAHTIISLCGLLPLNSSPRLNAKNAHMHTLIPRNARCICGCPRPILAPRVDALYFFFFLFRIKTDAPVKWHTNLQGLQLQNGGGFMFWLYEEGILKAQNNSLGDPNIDREISQKAHWSMSIQSEIFLKNIF